MSVLLQMNPNQNFGSVVGAYVEAAGSWIRESKQNQWKQLNRKIRVHFGYLNLTSLETANKLI